VESSKLLATDGILGQTRHREDQDYIDKEKFMQYRRTRKRPRFIYAECEILPEWAPAVKVKVRNKPKIRHTNKMKKEKNTEQTKNQNAEESYLKNIISAKPDEAMSVIENIDPIDQQQDNIVIDQELDNDNPPKNITSKLKNNNDSKENMEKQQQPVKPNQFPNNFIGTTPSNPDIFIPQMAYENRHPDVFPDKLTTKRKLKSKKEINELNLEKDKEVERDNLTHLVWKNPKGNGG
jgi:hypothetical protein